MGVLDEAIREHLELKRRHGADPGEVAHLERGALGSAHDDEGALPIDGEHTAMRDAANEANARLASASQDAPGGGETIEIDMRALIEDGERSPEPAEAAGGDAELDEERIERDSAAAPTERQRRSTGRFPSDDR